MASAKVDAYNMGDTHCYTPALEKSLFRTVIHSIVRFDIPGRRATPLLNAWVEVAYNAATARIE